jgi:hypothetical protein
MLQEEIGVLLLMIVIVVMIIIEVVRVLLIVFSRSFVRERFVKAP